jgi:anti-anti-sigma factor
VAEAAVSPSLSNAGSIHSIFTAVRDGCPDRHVIVDLTGVAFLDSTGLNELLRLRLSMTMRLVAPTGSVPRRIVDVSGLSRLFAMFETVDNALEQSERRRPRFSPHPFTTPPGCCG